MIPFKSRSSTLVAAAFSAMVLASSAAAQPGPGGWGPGMMMGPGMMGSGMIGSGMCNPRAAGLAEWRVEMIERVVRPTDAQRGALSDLKAASTKAAETRLPPQRRGAPQQKASLFGHLIGAGKQRRSKAERTGGLQNWGTVAK
jgi:hypothetical protein